MEGRGNGGALNVLQAFKLLRVATRRLRVPPNGTGNKFTYAFVFHACFVCLLPALHACEANGQMNRTTLPFSQSLLSVCLPVTQSLSLSVSQSSQSRSLPASQSVNLSVSHFHDNQSGR